MNIHFVPARDDDDTDHDIEGCVYLHVKVVVNGENEGAITGYYPPEVAAHIRKLLGAQEKQ